LYRYFVSWSALAVVQALETIGYYHLAQLSGRFLFPGYRHRIRRDTTARLRASSLPFSFTAIITYFPFSIILQGIDRHG